ncbi:hypothetical protein H6P81_003770 [Aristolochia fimbriata]|uniref:Uncharacterized protein n=1 Tax=Aristolochia fimbriata TaxID=158543 RepID=A0AAV7FDI8_ARIFI|nr:hypothetical protein H6P81_003770 [Aristolochia fimbriata]
MKVTTIVYFERGRHLLCDEEGGVDYDRGDETRETSSSSNSKEPPPRPSNPSLAATPRITMEIHINWLQESFPGSSSHRCQIHENHAFSTLNLYLRFFPQCLNACMPLFQLYKALPLEKPYLPLQISYSLTLNLSWRCFNYFPLMDKQKGKGKLSEPDSPAKFPSPTLGAKEVGSTSVASDELTSSQNSDPISSLLDSLLKEATLVGIYMGRTPSSPYVVASTIHEVLNSAKLLDPNINVLLLPKGYLTIELSSPTFCKELMSPIKVQDIVLHLYP